MTIYQIHEYGGAWEDSFDYIVGTYLDKNKAEEELKRLEEKEENRPKCEECCLYYCPPNCEVDCEACRQHYQKIAKEICPNFEAYYDDGLEDIGCANYKLEEKSYFRIKAHEVIE